MVAVDLRHDQLHIRDLCLRYLEGRSNTSGHGARRSFVVELIFCQGETRTRFFEAAARASSSASSAFSRIILVARHRDSNVPASVHPPSMISYSSFPSNR